MMDHPNIARVLDAGATETGRPYFVMELVRGVKITDYCDQNRLTTGDRLRLFVQVCKAVQHAHQKGIIHRDIKPANILVTLHDGVPVPKVIDFGIAKATGQQRLTDRTLFTSFQQFIGTPAYMSPEQAEMSGLDVDTRSDIYSLGVLLYELLTGRTPFDSKGLLAAGLNGMRKTICEQEPTLPSTKLRSLEANELTSAAQQRQTSPPRLLTLLRGDLDWVAMKCLEKDRTRRYETAEALALDIGRYLFEEPVSARPLSRLYQFRKLVHRNKGAFAASSAIAAALVFGLSLSTSLYFRERSALHTAAENATAARSSAKSETQQRLRAEQAVTRLETETAELLFAQNDSSRALAYLARLLRQQPTNHVVAQRIASALSQRNFCIPITPPLKHGPPLKPGRPWDPKARIHPALDGSITAAEFSNDGGFVLTASRDGTAVVWDIRTGEPLLAPFEHDDEVLSADFSFDAQHIATACRDHRAYLWSAVNGRLVAPPLEHDGPVLSVEFSPNGKRVVTASGDGTAKVWNAETGQLIAGPLRHTDALTTAQFSNDGRWILTASYDRSARVWDAETGTPRARAFIQFNSLPVADFSSDGEKAAAGCFNWMISIWKSASTEPILVSSAHQGGLLATVFTPDSKLLLSAAQDGRVRFSDADEGRVLNRFIKHNAAVNSLAISSDGTIVATGSHDTTARLWDVETALPLTEPINHDSPVVLVALSRDASRVLTVSQNGEAMVWQVRPPPSSLLQLTHGIRPLGFGRFSPSGEFVLTVGTGTDQYAKIWESATGTLVAVIPHSRIISSVDFSPDGNLVATASIDGLAKLWDVRSNKLRASLRHTGEITTIRFHPEGHLVLTASNDGTAKLWKLSGDLVREVKHRKYSHAMADFAPNGESFITASERGASEIWETGTGQLLGNPVKHDHDIISVIFSHDGRRFVTTSSDKYARIWNVEQGGPADTLLRHDEEVTGTSFSPDDTFLATCFGSAARIWNVRTGRPITDLLRHRARVNSANFSPDGRYLITSSDDGTARIWDVATGHAVSEPLRHSDAVTSAEFSPDGTQVLTTGRNGLAKILNCPAVGEPIPLWLADLAEAFSGQRLNVQNEFEHVSPSELWRQLAFLQKSEATNLDKAFNTPFLSVRSGLPGTGPQHAMEEFLSSVRYTRAMEENSPATPLTPPVFFDLSYRANAHAMLERFQDATNDLRQALTLNPVFPQGLNDLAWLLSENFSRPDQALPLALEAVALEPSESEFWNTLGVIYYRLAKYHDSLRAFEEVARLRPDGLVAYDLFFLAMNHHQIGNLVKAEEYFAKAVDDLTRRSGWSSVAMTEIVDVYHREAAVVLGKSPAK
jgi:WD40 repeat protein/serine/threonine protein kinase/tetratricopeptide (TPR) repeat protein